MTFSAAAISIHNETEIFPLSFSNEYVDHGRSHPHILIEIEKVNCFDFSISRLRILYTTIAAILRNNLKWLFLFAIASRHPYQ